MVRRLYEGRNPQPYRRFSQPRFRSYPQLNSFGHANEWLGSEPGEIEKYELADLFSETQYRDTLNLCNPRVYDLLFDCYTEMLEVYGNPKYFHVGMDEARRREFGKQLNCNRALPHEIFAAHANRIADFFDQRGITPIMWADLLLDPAQFPGLEDCNGGPPTDFAKAFDVLSRSYVLADWHYTSTELLPNLKHLSSRGLKLWTAPWKDRPNTYAHALAASSLHLDGICATTWNFFDRGADRTREIDNLAAPVLVGNYAWNPTAPVSSDEKEVFRRAWEKSAAFATSNQGN